MVVPVLVGDEIVAAIDLKTDRGKQALLVQKWNWVGNGSARSHKKQIEDSLSTDYSLLGIADHGGSPHTNGDIWNHYTPEYFGFEYEAYQLQKTANTYISDNQGKWRSPLKHAQTYMLVHPTWWPV